MNRRRRRILPATLLVLTSGIHAPAAAAGPAQADIAGSRHRDRLFSSIHLADPAAAHRSPGHAGEAADDLLGQAGYTAAEKLAINEAVMLNHPSVVVLADPTRRYECHGFTFAAGQRRIDGSLVEAILAEQGWTLRVAGAHQVGDIVIYRRNGAIAHSGVVSAVEDGTVTRVTSKWGAAGLYEHDPDDVPDGYGRFEVRHGGAASAAVRAPTPDSHSRARLRSLRGTCCKSRRPA